MAVAENDGDIKSREDSRYPLQFLFKEAETDYVSELLLVAEEIGQLANLEDKQSVAKFLELASGFDVELRKKWFSNATLHLHDHDLQDYLRDLNCADKAQLTSEIKDLADKIVSGFNQKDFSQLRAMHLPNFSKLILHVNRKKADSQLRWAVTEMCSGLPSNREVQLSALTVAIALFNIFLERNANNGNNVQGNTRATLAHLSAEKVGILFNSPEKFDSDFRDILRTIQSIDSNYPLTPTLVFMNNLLDKITALYNKLKNESQNGQKPGQSAKKNGRRKTERTEGKSNAVHIIISKVLVLVEKKKSENVKIKDDDVQHIMKNVWANNLPDSTQEALLEFLKCPDFKEYLETSNVATLSKVKHKFCEVFDVDMNTLNKEYQSASDTEDEKRRTKEANEKVKKNGKILQILTGDNTCPGDDVFQFAYPILRNYFKELKINLVDEREIRKQLTKNARLKLATQFLIGFIGSLFQMLEQQKLLSTSRHDYGVHWYAAEVRNELFHASRLHQPFGVGIKKHAACLLKNIKKPDGVSSAENNKIEKEQNVNDILQKNSTSSSSSDNSEAELSMSDAELSCRQLARFVYIFNRFR